MEEVESEYRLRYTRSKQVNTHLKKENISKDLEIESLKKQIELLNKTKSSQEFQQQQQQQQQQIKTEVTSEDKEIEKITNELSEMKVSHHLMSMKFEMKSTKLKDTEKLCQLYEAQNEQLHSYLYDQKHGGNLLELTNQEARYKDDVICKQNKPIGTQTLRIKFLSKLCLKADQKLKERKQAMDQLESNISDLQRELIEYEQSFASFNRYFKMIQRRDSHAKLHVHNLQQHFNNIKQSAFQKVFNKRQSLSRCESIDIVNKLASVFNLSSEK